jgi:DNA-binding MarR family transcriptional regulator
MNGDGKAAKKGSEALLFALLHAARQLGTRLDNGLAAVGSSVAKHGVLTMLVQARKPVALGELAAFQRCVRSNMTQLVDRLEADGLVKRVPDPEDRRSVLAALTPAGRECQAAGAEELDRVATELAAAISDEDRDAFERVLDALH